MQGITMRSKDFFREAERMKGIAGSKMLQPLSFNLDKIVRISLRECLQK